MNVLILGSGGREHAFAWKISQSPKCGNLFIAPGNAGTAQVGTNLSIGVNDFPNIEQAILDYQIELMIVGPEDPLVNGVVDYFRAKKAFKKLKIVGPNAAGAQLEGSKDFSKSFMARHGIPTAASQTFTSETFNAGTEYLSKQSLPIVLKADGLAAGKGVIIAETHAHAQETLKDMLLDAKFGSASSKVVIEQFLTGIELSVFVLTDGKNYKILPEAKDYKRIGEGDKGLNTGGMGAVSPVPFADEAFMQNVEEKVVKPTLAGLIKDHIDYRGFIFIGLMNTNGEPWVIEYNARMGDPETEVVLPRIKTDFLKLMIAAADQKLDKVTLKTSPKAAVTTMVVAKGYPEDYTKGDVMTIPIPDVDSYVFHAGTKLENGNVVTNGGRVMALTGLARTVKAAVKKSQKLAKAVSFTGKNFRRDIGKDILAIIEKS